MAHSGTSCCTPESGNLACCSPEWFDFRSAEFGSDSPCAGAGEDCLFGVSGLAGDPAFFGASTTSGEPGFPEEPGSWLGAFSPLPGGCLLRDLWSLPRPRDIRLRRPTDSSSLTASFFVSGFGGAAGGGGGGGGLGLEAAFSPFLPRGGCSGDLAPRPGGSLALLGSSPGSTLPTTFLTALATRFRDRPWASSFGPSAEAAPRPFIVSVASGLFALWEVSEGGGLVAGWGLLGGPLLSLVLPSSYSHINTSRHE